MLFCALFLFWMLLNARLTAETVLIGLAVAGAVWYFCVRALELSPRGDFRLLLRLPAILRYLLFLLKETLLAALRVCRLIWTPGVPVSSVESFSSGLKTAPARALLAESITLTPGTITVEMEDGNLLVHSLDASSSAGAGPGDLARRIQRLEEGRS